VRRFGSTMSSNTDSTLLIYPKQHIPVKEYSVNRTQTTVPSGCVTVPGGEAGACPAHRGGNLSDIGANAAGPCRSGCAARRSWRITANT